MPTTPKLGLRYPALSDSPNGPVAIGNLASDVDALGVIGGKRRVNDSSNITTIESIVVDSQTISLAANSVFEIEYFLSFTASVAASDAVMRIRLTSVSGTILGEAIALGVYVAPSFNQQSLRAIYKTTAAELQYFCGTIVRQVGTGNLVAKPATNLTITCIGPSSILGDF